MLHYAASFLLVLAIFGSQCHQAPAAGTSKHYELGSVYNYDYVLGLELNEPVAVPSSNNNHVNFGESVKTPSTVGYKVLAQVQVRPVWQNEGQGAILEISLKQPQLQIKSRKAPQPDGFRDHSSQLESAVLHPLYVHWKDGRVSRIYSVTSDDVSLINVKKGIANLLQAELGTGTQDESTPMGECSVHKERSGNRLVKSIQGQCNQAQIANFLISSHNSQALGTDIDSKVTTELTFNQETGTVEEAQVTERHEVRTVAKQEVGATITASQSFKLLEMVPSSEKIVRASSSDAAIKEISKANGYALTANTLMGEYELGPRCDANSCKEYDTLNKLIVKDNLATTKMASAFIHLVAKFREASTDEIYKILKSGKKNVPVLLDACAAAGTVAAHKAALKLLDFDEFEVIVREERYLLGLSLAPSPPVEAVQDLFALVKKRVPSEKLRESLLLTTAAVINNVRLSTRKKGSESTKVGAEFESHVLESLEKCKDDDAPCKQTYLRALKNLKSPSTLAKLFEMVQISDPKTSVVAMKAIHAFPDTAIEPSHRPLLVKIVKQLGSKYDSSARTLALDMILRNKPSKVEVREILHVVKQLDNPNHSEVSTFVWNRLQEFAEHNPVLAETVKRIVREEGLQNYHHLAPKGLSTAFSRPFTVNPKGNSTFSNAIEMTGKILKRSSFDVYLNTPEDSLHLLSLGIFTGGLTSFAGGDENAVEDADEPATAGMELSLMGVQLRPIVFFTGKGELMGLVWSGAGSERTPALQGNVLLQDEKLLLRLYCGLVADINIHGSLSFELAGQIQISLWGRTANSLVENKAGLVLQSTIRVDTSFVKSRVDHSTAADAALHFISDINFYDGVLMCMKLTQPEFVVKQNVHKTERIPGSKHKLRKAKYKSLTVPGITYALNRKNSEQCSIMYQNE